MTRLFAFAPHNAFFRTSASVVALLAPLFAWGCGGDPTPEAANPLKQVKGKVKLEAPGASLTNLRIAFLQDGPGARTARGDVKADGTFELMTAQPGDGVAEGKYTPLTATIAPDTSDVTVVVSADAAKKAKGAGAGPGVGGREMRD
jgi:hypothetical protein